MFVAFAVVRVKILTYQSCHDTKRQKVNANKHPQVLRLTTPRLTSTPGAPFAQDDKLEGEFKMKELWRSDELWRPKSKDLRLLLILQH
jgi:hypothetical protein